MPTTNPRPEAPDAGSDIRPLNCRDRLESEGKAHPKSGCEVEGCQPLFGRQVCAGRNPTPAARASAAGDEAPRDVVALIEDLRSVNDEQAPYANRKVRGWCWEAADRIADLLLERDEARAALSASRAAPTAGTVATRNALVALGIDTPVANAVVTAFDGKQGEQPAWLWFDKENGDRGLLTYGRWAKAGGQVPYIRGDILARLSDTNTSTPGHPVRIGYTNWRGEATTPTIVPARIFWGSNEWHPEPCWLLEAMDVEKQALRAFDLRKIRAAGDGLGPANAAATKEPREADNRTRMVRADWHGKRDEGGFGREFWNAVTGRWQAAPPDPLPPAPASAVGEAKR